MQVPRIQSTTPLLEACKKTQRCRNPSRRVGLVILRPPEAAGVVVARVVAVAPTSEVVHAVVDAVTVVVETEVVRWVGGEEDEVGKDWEGELALAPAISLLRSLKSQPFQLLATNLTGPQPHPGARSPIRVYGDSLQFMNHVSDGHRLLRHPHRLMMLRVIQKYLCRLS
jgi:hypothetical protein